MSGVGRREFSALSRFTVGSVSCESVFLLESNVILLIGVPLSDGAPVKLPPIGRDRSADELRGLSLSGRSVTRLPLLRGRIESAGLRSLSLS